MTEAAFWDKIAEKYASDPIENLEGYHKTRDMIVDRLKPEHRVLELGCGTGSTALEIAKHVQDYLATDLSPKMIEIANAKRDTQTPENLRFAVADGAGLPDFSPDVVLALNLIHLVPNADAMIQEIFDRLPQGGLFIAKTACLRDGPWYLAVMIPLMRLIGKAPHVSIFSQAELTGRLQKAGFVIDETLLQKGTAPRLFTIARKP